LQGDLPVNFDLPLNYASQISCQIIAYLVEHPEAQDTLEGIIEWWLLERQIKFQTAKVKEALSELVAKGLVIEHNGRDSQTHYRINNCKRKEIPELFKQKYE